MLRQPRRRLGPHAGLAIEQKRLLARGSLKPMYILKVSVGDMEALHGRCDGDIYSTGNLAGSLQFGRFTNICASLIPYC